TNMAVATYLLAVALVGLVAVSLVRDRTGKALIGPDAMDIPGAAELEATLQDGAGAKVATPASFDRRAGYCATDRPGARPRAGPGSWRASAPSPGRSRGPPAADAGQRSRPGRSGRGRRRRGRPATRPRHAPGRPRSGRWG